MALSNAYQQYQESQINTASRGKLLVMTYDGAIRFIRQGQAYMVAKAYAEQNSCIVKAERLILELIYSLNPKVDPDLAHRLTILYEYMFNRLVEANLSDNLDALKEVEQHLIELRGAWADADQQLSQSVDTPVEEARYAVAGSSR